MRTNDEHAARLRVLLNEQFERTEVVRAHLTELVANAERDLLAVKDRANGALASAELELAAIREKLNELAPAAS